MPRASSIACGRAIITAEASAIASIELTAAFDSAGQALQSCLGEIVTTGLGKAGLLARKFAGTLCSTGTPAGFLRPGEAARGDVGSR
jgi:arabinose-5-phosphate isomerase